MERSDSKSSNHQAIADRVFIYIYIYIYYNILLLSCANPEGAHGGSGPPPPHLTNHKNIVSLSNTGPDPLKNHKVTEPANVAPS